MFEQPSLFQRLFRYGRLLMGHGKDLVVFWIATASSIWTALAPASWQRHLLLAIHIPPDQRLVVLGFGLAGFFLYAGFRVWSAEQQPTSIHSLHEQIAELRQGVGRHITKKQRQLFQRATKSNTLPQRGIGIVFSDISHEAHDYCLELVELLRSVGIASGGGNGTSQWKELDVLGLAVVVADTAHPPEAATQIAALFKSAGINFSWATDYRLSPMRVDDVYIYVGKNPDNYNLELD